MLAANANSNTNTQVLAIIDKINASWSKKKKRELVLRVYDNNVPKACDN